MKLYQIYLYTIKEIEAGREKVEFDCPINTEVSEKIRLYYNYGHDPYFLLTWREMVKKYNYHVWRKS